MRCSSSNETQEKAAGELENFPPSLRERQVSVFASGFHCLELLLCSKFMKEIRLEGQEKH